MRQRAEQGGALLTEEPGGRIPREHGREGRQAGYEVSQTQWAGTSRTVPAEEAQPGARSARNTPEEGEEDSHEGSQAEEQARLQDSSRETPSEQAEEPQHSASCSHRSP